MTHEDLIQSGWIRERLHLMTPQALEANRRISEKTATLERWRDGELVTDREREDALECVRIIEAEMESRGLPTPAGRGDQG